MLSKAFVIPHGLLEDSMETLFVLYNACDKKLQFLAYLNGEMDLCECSLLCHFGSCENNFWLLFILKNDAYQI